MRRSTLVPRFQSHAVLVACLLFAGVTPISHAADNSLPTTAEDGFLEGLQRLETAKTDPNDIDNTGWALRSGHFVFGMPKLSDDRYSFTPDGFTARQPGISVIAREGFVVAHFDRMKVPLWVAQRWTKFDADRMDELGEQSRPWREDLELPGYARGGTSYEGNKTKLDRGHMARHAPNRAWGVDTSNFGVKMSNSAPQHRTINRGGAWRELEDEIVDVVSNDPAEIEAVWTITGTIWRDAANPAGETPEDDFAAVVRLPSGGFGVPDATYKVVGWFDDSGFFQARAYVFEQPHTASFSGDNISLIYDLGDPQPLVKHLVKIDDLEERTGVDFFPCGLDPIWWTV